MILVGFVLNDEGENVRKLALLYYLPLLLVKQLIAILIVKRNPELIGRANLSSSLDLLWDEETKT